MKTYLKAPVNILTNEHTPLTFNLYYSTVKSEEKIMELRINNSDILPKDRQNDFPSIPL